MNPKVVNYEIQNVMSLASFESFKLRPEKCFKIGNLHPRQQTQIEAHSSEATQNCYDAYLNLGLLIGRNIIEEFQIGQSTNESTVTQRVEPISVYQPSYTANEPSRLYEKPSYTESRTYENTTDEGAYTPKGKVEQHNQYPNNMSYD